MNTAMTLMTNILGYCVTSRDDNVTPAPIYVGYSGTPENLVDLFITDEYDVLSIIGNPNVVPERFIQDEQVYETWDVPIKLMTINKYTAGTLVSTAPVTLQKVVALFLNQVNTSKHGTSWIATVTRGTGEVKRRAGINIHEENFMVKVRVMV